MRAHAAAGARVMKLHPTVQQFYPDDPVVFPIYEEARALGLILFFHGGRAGIEPRDRLRYAMPRHYEGVLKNFPELPVVLGHGGARDARAMLAMSRPYANAWLGIHGQSLRMLETIIEASAGERLLFGTDWPWYHIGATLAKVLLCTDRPQRQKQRRMILRDNAIALMPELASS
jgi:predicted TIM-barrel fold metal-dependent hydrolase